MTDKYEELMKKRSEAPLIEYVLTQSGNSFESVDGYGHCNPTESVSEDDLCDDYFFYDYYSSVTVPDTTNQDVEVPYSSLCIHQPTAATSSSLCIHQPTAATSSWCEDDLYDDYFFYDYYSSVTVPDTTNKYVEVPSSSLCIHQPTAATSSLTTKAKRRKTKVRKAKKKTKKAKCTLHPHFANKSYHIKVDPSVHTIMKTIDRFNGKLGSDGYDGASYGEQSIGSFQHVIEFLKKHCQLTKNSRFIDIGCGQGKPNFHVSKDVRLSIGVELETIRWKLAMFNLHMVWTKNSDLLSARGGINFIDSDILAAKTLVNGIL
jgi:hypothetical protein